MFDMDEAVRPRHEKGADPVPSSERSFDCSELQRAHAHQAKGTWDPLATEQFHWSQEVVDRLLARVICHNVDRKRPTASGPMPDLTVCSLAHIRTKSSGSIDGATAAVEDGNAVIVAIQAGKEIPM